MRAAFKDNVLDNEAIAVIGAVRHRRAQRRALGPRPQPSAQCTEALVAEPFPAFARIHLLPVALLLVRDSCHARTQGVLHHARDLYVIALLVSPGALRYPGEFGGRLRRGAAGSRAVGPKLRGGIARSRSELECGPVIGR